MKPRRIALAALAAFVALVACPGPTVPSIPLETLLAAPEQVVIGGRTFTLETFVWRDFMPGGASGGSDLGAVVLLTAEDHQPFPAELDADRLWVVYDGEVWESEFTGESGPPDQTRLYQLEKRAGGGPKWETGVLVEVVVRLVSRSGGRQLLRASAQTIHRTE